MAENIAGLLYHDMCKTPSDVLMRDIVNGAMLANLVQIAVSIAVKRDIAAKAKKGSGFRARMSSAASLRMSAQARTM